MHNEKDNIENLFSKKFEKFEVKSSDQEWLELSSKLSKTNFLKFSFITFNVYYLMVLVTFAGTATFTGIRNMQLSNKVEKLEQAVQSYQIKEQTNSSPATYSDSIKSLPTAIEENKPAKNLNTIIETKKKDEPEIKVKAKEEEKTVSPPPVNLPMEVKDNSLKPEVPSSVDSASKPKFRMVKKTLVVKPKPIVLKDTVVITKRVK